MQNSFETYETTLPVVCLTAQTAVECKLVGGGEFSSLLALHTIVVPTGKEVLSGEFRYSGKLLFSACYEDTDGEVRRIERGAEFTHSIEHPALAPAQSAKLRIKVLKTSLRRENGNLYVSAIVSPEVEIFAPATFTYLADTDLISKKGELTLYRRVTAGGMSECEDEFETELINDVLTHSEQLLVEKAECRQGTVNVEGKIALLVTALKEEGICSYERLVPFFAEIPCESARPFLSVKAEAILRSATINVDADEDKGKSVLLSDFTLEFFCTVWEKSVVQAVEDAFSPTKEIELCGQSPVFPVPAECVVLTEHIAGVCACNETLDFASEVKCITSVKASAQIGERLEGVLTANAILADREGGLKKVELTCPFSFPVKERGEVSLLVCGCKVTQKKEGELEAEATVKACVVGVREERAFFLSECKEGKDVGERRGGISVFLPSKGDGLWETAKRLRIKPEEVERLNPDLSYPLTGKERILLYRQK